MQQKKESELSILKGKTAVVTGSTSGQEADALHSLLSAACIAAPIEEFAMSIVDVRPAVEAPDVDPSLWLEERESPQAPCLPKSNLLQTIFAPRPYDILELMRQEKEA